MLPQQSPRTTTPDRLSTTHDPPGFAVWSLTVIDAPVADSRGSLTPTTASEGVGGEEMLLLLGRCFGALCSGSNTTNTNACNSSTTVTVPLSALTIRFYAGFRHRPAKASVLKVLCTQYIPYVCGLSTLRILYNKQDECEDVSALAVTMGRLTQLTFNGCGLTSISHCLPNQQCLRILDLSYCQRLVSLEGLESGASCPALEEVRLASTAITSLRALKDCPALVKFDVTYCDALESLEGLEDHMLLEEVNATETAIVSLDGLQGCSNLRTLIIWGCRQLSSLELVDVDLSSSSNQKSDEKGSDGSGSHVAPFFSLCRLETLSAGYTAISSIQALQWCRQLKNLDLSHCEELTSLDGLGAAHGHLEEINVSNTAITSVRALAVCGTYSLRTVILEGCTLLASLDGLGDHPLLKEIDASYTAITTVGETLLGSFALRKLTLFSCEQLTSMEGLESHVFLEDLNVGSTPITSLRPLCGCAALRRVYLRCCQHLTSLEGVEHHAHLEDLSLSRTAVTSLSALRVTNKLDKVDKEKSREERGEETSAGCSALKKLDVSHCQYLSSIEGLEDHVLLEDVDVSWTAIASLNGLQGCCGLWRLLALSCKSLTSVQALDGCCALKTLNLSGCPLLTSLEGLGAAHGHLEEINVSNTAVSCVHALQECCPSLRKVTNSKPENLLTYNIPRQHHFGA